MWLLLIEDEERLANSIRRGLVEEGYTVDVAHDGEQGLSQARVNPYDLLVIDWRLPRKDGRMVVQTLREEGFQTPIIMLTALGDIDHKVAGLDAGADDYLTKPFAFEELLARIRARLRRGTDTLQAPFLQAGPLALDTARRQVTVQGTPLFLRPKAYALLEALMRHPDQPLTRTILAERVWGTAFHVRDNVIDVTVSGLRQHLQDALTNAALPADSVCIETVWGVGYRLTAQQTA